MGTPADPAVADQAVRDQLAQQAVTVQGSPAAGVYGDPAGASRPAEPADISDARPAAIDGEELLARLRELEARAAAQDAAAAPALEEAPDLSLRADQSAPSWLHDVLARIERRLDQLENHPE